MNTSVFANGLQKWTFGQQGNWGWSRCKQGVQWSGKSQGNSIPGKSQGIVREFCYGSGKIKNVGKSQGKVREFWTGHGYGGFMSNLKHFGQHPHSLLMELLASVTWMSSSYDSLDIIFHWYQISWYTIFPVTIHGNYSLQMKMKGFGTPFLQSCFIVVIIRAIILFLFPAGA